MRAVTLPLKGHNHNSNESNLTQKLQYVGNENCKKVLMICTVSNNIYVGSQAKASWLTIVVLIKNINVSSPWQI